MSLSFDVHAACQGESVSRGQQEYNVSEQTPLGCRYYWLLELSAEEDYKMTFLPRQPQALWHLDSRDEAQRPAEA